MGNPLILPSERAAVVGVINPQSGAAGTYSTAWIAMKDFQTIQAILLAGALGASGTVDAKLQQAKDGAGTGAKDIAGKAITQLTQAGTDSNKQAVINLRDDELDVNNDFTHARLLVTNAVAASLIAAVVLGHDARTNPATDLASVDEIVA